MRRPMCPHAVQYQENVTDGCAKNDTFLHSIGYRYDGSMFRRTHQTTSFVNALKRCLRARGMTYAALAAQLKLSEATVKRCFSRQTLSLRRIEEIVSALDMTLLDVAKLAAEPMSAVSAQLSLEQERALAASPRLFSFFHLLLIGLSLHKIVREYEIELDEALRSVKQLERLRLIEVLPRNKVRLLTSKNLLWHAHGPLRQAYEQPIRQRFLDHSFAGAKEYRKFSPGRLSAASQTILLRKLKRLVAEMDSLAQVDASNTDEESEISGMFLAFRSFEFDHLLDLSRRRPPRQTQGKNR